VRLLRHGAADRRPFGGVSEVGAHSKAEQKAGRPKSVVFGEIASAIGRTSACRLIEQLGGRRIYIPRAMEQDHEIARAIGADAAALLATYFHGTWISLPVSHDRRRAVRELGKDPELTRAAIARETGYTERHVYRILGDQDDSQGDLFGS
jgi:CRP-like cAMP-binding protein